MRDIIVEIARLAGAVAVVAILSLLAVGLAG